MFLCGLLSIITTLMPSEKSLQPSGTCLNREKPAFIDLERFRCRLRVAAAALHATFHPKFTLCRAYCAQ